MTFRQIRRDDPRKPGSAATYRCSLYRSDGQERIVGTLRVTGLSPRCWGEFFPNELSYPNRQAIYDLHARTRIEVQAAAEDLIRSWGAPRFFEVGGEGRAE